MTQVLPAALVAPTRASQSVGFLIRAVDGTTIATAFTTTGVTEVSATGYYRVNGGITAPDDGGTLEWYLNNAGSAGTFLSAVAIEPAPNQADQAAGIRTALGLANPDLDTQLGNIPTTTEIWTHATRALTDAVTVGTINNNAITANSINSGAITNAKFAAGAIDAAAIATDAITAAKIADNAIDAGSIASGAITNAKFAAGAIDATAVADNAIDGGALATNAIEKIQANLATQASVDTKASQASVDALPDAVWDEPLSGHTSTGTTGKKLTDTSTLTVGDIPPGLSAADVWTHATRALTDKDNFGLADNAIDADTLATSAVTEIQNGLATAASISTPAQIASQVRTELATELARINVDLSTRLAAADYVAPDNTGILTAIGALPSASTIADAVWDEALSGHLTAGSTGAKLNLASTLTVSDIPAGLTAQQVWEYATRMLTTASGLTTEQNTRLNELWRKAGLDLATPVVRILNPATGNVTETLGATTITHTETNSGNTVTSARQP